MKNQSPLSVLGRGESVTSSGVLCENNHVLCVVLEIYSTFCAHNAAGCRAAVVRQDLLSFTFIKGRQNVYTIGGFVLNYYQKLNLSFLMKIIVLIGKGLK